jgi:hypothetical protein
MPNKEKSIFNINGQVEGGIINIGGEQNISGTIILNMRSHLEGAMQQIERIPSIEQSRKDELTNLVNQLKTQLEKSPPEKAEQTKQVATQVEILIKEASVEQPNKENIATAGENLKKAAENLFEVMPIVLQIATQLVTHILSSLR